MPYLIDGNNVLHAEKPDLFAGLCEQRLIGCIGQSGLGRQGVTLVFDGPARSTSKMGLIDGVEIYYSGKVTADSVMIGLVRQSSAPRRLVVVSDDRAIQKVAKARQCFVQASTRFLERLAKAIEQADTSSGSLKKAKPDATGFETAAWLKEMGFEQEAQQAQQQAETEQAIKPKTIDDEVQRLLDESPLPPELGGFKPCGRLDSNDD